MIVTTATKIRNLTRINTRIKFQYALCRNKPSPPRTPQLLPSECAQCGGIVLHDNLIHATYVQDYNRAIVCMESYANITACLRRKFSRKNQTYIPLVKRVLPW